MSGAQLQDRYEASLLGLFGRPALVVARGEGRHVVDTDGRRYLDLFGGIAVSALGHGHPALVEAIRRQAGEVLHVSNFFTTTAQVELAERLLEVAAAPPGSRVFLCSSGAEANEAAIKLARRTGRTRLVAMAGAFHGRTTGALALTAKPAYREPFEPLLPGVEHVPFGDVGALARAVDEQTAAVVLEPVQGEAGVVVPPPDFLPAARQITQDAGALLVVDEVQTGVGRTGAWFAHRAGGVVPDAMTVAKGLGGGVPIGALVTFGPQVSALLGPGQHGTTFGGNPLAAAAALAVLRTIEQDGLLQAATERGEQLRRGVLALGHPLVEQVRGAGLLQAVVLTRPVAAQVASAAREAGFLVNPVTPQALRLAPALTVTAEEIDSFVAALPALLDPHREDA